MFSLNLSGRERILVTASLVLAAIAIGYNVVIEPLMRNWKRLNSQIDAKATVLVKDMRLLRMYKRLETEHSKYRDFITTTKKEEELLAHVLSEIENISKKTSCYIANVKPRTTKKVGNYKEISFIVTAEAAVDKLAKFLYAVETSKELLRVRHFAITPKSGRQGTLKSTFHISN